MMVLFCKPIKPSSKQSLCKKHMFYGTECEKCEISWIERRIKSEYKKHQRLDWARIAAAKIYSTMRER